MLKRSKHTLNLIGIRCPEILMMIRKKMREINNGDKIIIISDDITAIRDIILFCNFMNHTIVYKNTKTYPIKFLLQKGLK